MTLSFSTESSSKRLHFLPPTSKTALNQAWPAHFSNTSPATDQLPKNTDMGQLTYSTTLERSQITYSIRSGVKIKYNI